MTSGDADAWVAFDTECSQMARAAGKGFVSLVGTGPAISVNAAIRGRISAHLNGRTKADGMRRSAVHMVIRNTVIRGVVMALSWLSSNRSVDKITPHDTMKSALAAAKHDLRAERIDWTSVERWLAECEQ